MPPVARHKARIDLPELTSLRVLAALCVVVSHIHALGLASAPRVHDWLDGGRPAVAFFFVLSGFIMHHVYPDLRASDHEASRRYAMARFARLYPTLLLAFCLALPSGLYLTQTHATHGLLQFYALNGRYAQRLMESGLAQLFGLTGWIPAAAINQPWNGAAWSLSCEFFFYAMFPIIQPLVQRRSSRSLGLMLLAVWVLQGCAMVAIQSTIPANRAGFLIYQFPLVHLFEFLLGLCAGIMSARASRQPLWLLGIGAALATVSMQLGIHLAHLQMPASYALSPLFALIIVWVARASGTPWLAPLRYRSFVALGHASYALYIVHVPILVAAAVFGLGANAGWLWVPALMLMSLAIHYGFAEPSRRLLLGHARRAVPVAAASMLPAASKPVLPSQGG
jgi:peptidoglycan/LPS O-acetylase OafA/YrhL